mmetsp:Transcript_14124/g.30639  ORF Transcript_14124/g.30639 Transcript_14124/m.30639 type:complete len:291 (-) Transcript_14124:13-885(-)
MRQVCGTGLEASMQGVPQPLHCHHSGCSDLHLLLGTGWNLLLRLNLGFEVGCVLHNAHYMEHYRHPVVGKHGELVNVVKGPQSSSLEGPVHITHKDLCPLVQEHLTAAVHGMVPEPGEVAGHQLHEGHCGLVGCSHQVGGLPLEGGEQAAADLPQQTCPLLLLGQLPLPAYQLANTRACDAAQPLSADAVGVPEYGGLDSPGHVLVLQLRVWPEAEVDGVHHQQVLSSQHPSIHKVHVCIKRLGPGYSVDILNRELPNSGLDSFVIDFDVNCMLAHEFSAANHNVLIHGF